ncbi:hypothetical protein FTX61_20710 [Nitriliruptoraceae bacterium ZYF776]|nr:hypothetical protein [Profundirhabdus halotolerans]
MEASAVGTVGDATTGSRGTSRATRRPSTRPRPPRRRRPVTVVERPSPRPDVELRSSARPLATAPMVDLPTRHRPAIAGPRSLHIGLRGPSAHRGGRCTTTVLEPFRHPGGRLRWVRVDAQRSPPTTRPSDLAVGRPDGHRRRRVAVCGSTCGAWVGWTCAWTASASPRRPAARPP